MRPQALWTIRRSMARASPTGRGFDPSQSQHIAKLAIETGVWPLKEAIRGDVRHTYSPEKRRPVVEYLEPQRRPAGLIPRPSR